MMKVFIEKKLKVGLNVGIVLNRIKGVEKLPGAL